MKEYVLVGSGGRGYWMYASAIAERYNDVAHLAGIMDVNQKRAEYVESLIPYEVPVFTDFDQMMDQADGCEGCTCAEECAAVQEEQAEEEPAPEAGEAPEAPAKEKPEETAAPEAEEKMEE